jgi:hypothetical protein
VDTSVLAPCPLGAFVSSWSLAPFRVRIQNVRPFSCGQRSSTDLPIGYTVDHRRKRIHAAASGSVTIADLGAYIASRVRDGVYDYDQLVDLSGAQLDIATQDVLQLVRQSRGNLSEKPIPFTAIVAEQGSWTYGVVRQLSTLFGFDGASVHVVDTVDEGREWLDQMQADAARGSEPANGAS